MKPSNAERQRVDDESKHYIAEIVKETIKDLQQGGNIRYSSNYFQKTEKLLYSYWALKETVKQKEEEIEYLERNGLPGKSKSIVLVSPRSTNSEGDAYIELQEGYRKSKELTEWLLIKIEHALDTVKSDKYFFIIEEKYFNKAKNDDILEQLETMKESDGTVGSSERTFQRHKKRLIQKIVITLFGAGALMDICEDIV